MRVYPATAREFRWLRERTGCVLTDDFTAIKAVDAFSGIRGMVGYSNNTPLSVQMHMAATTPLAWRYLLRPALSYPFLEGGKEIALGIIPEGNGPSLHFAKHVGMTERHRIQDGWKRGEDLILLELRRPKFIELCNRNFRRIHAERKAA